MGNSIRIRTTPNGGDKVIKVKLEQEFDFIEILSLKITQEDVYRRFCSDYGVVVGRVIANNGFGVPNAKVSIFIPLDSDDENDIVKSTLYPYKSVYDKNSDGVRYNLLPDTQKDNCYTPVGTFPSKTKVLDNDDILEIYEKYYKYTTTTNFAGDYMIFGVPVGNQILHVDVDLSDIGPLSQKPYNFIENGTSKELFESSTKFKSSTNLDSLAQIVTQNIGLEVLPFWGDPDNCQIGINRVDVDLNYNFQPSAIFIGSIFGDDEKNSINTRCYPSKKLGRICETITTSGSIEMIRKTLDDKIERFDIEGGRVIDENGAWAYQIPMNLDYVVTDEFGNAVPSEDPTKGIATKARVRFRIGMDETGGEGKQRRRAKFLVPNNPEKGDTDYVFDETTPNTQFTDLNWNHLYTVRNHISRYSKGNTESNVIALKDVDNCDSATPFPFNRIDIEVNLLFGIIDSLNRITIVLMVFLNAGIVRFFNSFISILKRLIRGLNYLLPDIPEPAYVACMVTECNGERYAPGCYTEGSLSDFKTPSYCNKVLDDSTKESLDDWENGGYCQASKEGVVDHWANDSHENLHNNQATCDPNKTKSILPTGNAGLVNCRQATLAESLNIIKFDFYNDWVNGTLYSFLLRYKKKKSGKNKFCEYDCDKSNNDCVDSIISDSGILTFKQVNLNSTPGYSVTVGEPYVRQFKDSGLIKRVASSKQKETLYYAAENKNGNTLLYATDLLNLGSVTDYNINGTPKIQQNLVTTSYNRPPLTIEGGVNNSDTDEAIDPLLVIIGNSGLLICPKHHFNISRICEIGVEIPTSTNSPTIQTINGTSLDNNTTDYTRDVIAFLNGGKSSVNQSLVSMETKFGDYPPNNTNEINYDLYRYFNNTSSMSPFFKRASYFFYFGLIPGSSALELANRKYFTECTAINKNAFILDINVIQNVTTINGSDGKIQINVDGGVGPYTFVLVDSLGNSTTHKTNNSTTFTNLVGGSYSISVTDSQGNVATGSKYISEPTAISFFESISDVTYNGGTDGQIMISSVSGGIGPYTATISSQTGTIPTTSIPIIGGSALFSNLPTGFYDITVSDNSAPSVTHSNIEVKQPIAVSLSISNIKNITCHNNNNGSFTIIATGQLPLSIKVYQFPLNGVYNSISYTNSSTLMSLILSDPSALSNKQVYSTIFNQGPLPEGYYVVKLIDSANQSIINPTSIDIINPSVITYSVINKTNTSCYGGNNGTITINGVNGGNPPYTYKLTNSSNVVTTQSTNIFNNLVSDTYNVELEDSTGCVKNMGSIYIEQPTEIMLTINSIVNTSGGNNNGQINASAIGGKINTSGNYQFTIDNFITTNSNGNFNGLAIGTYTVKVKDDNGCIKEKVNNIIA